MVPKQVSRAVTGQMSNNNSLAEYGGNEQYPSCERWARKIAGRSFYGCTSKYSEFPAVSVIAYGLKEPITFFCADFKVTKAGNLYAN
jgi:hypothetical protein